MTLLQQTMNLAVKSVTYPLLAVQGRLQWKIVIHVCILSIWSHDVRWLYLTIYYYNYKLAISLQTYLYTFTMT